MPETTDRPKRKVRRGIVGGGPGSNIGQAHHYAARLDDRYVLVTGVFASHVDRSRSFAATLDIAPDGRYGSWQEMAEREARRKGSLIFTPTLPMPFSLVGTVLPPTRWPTGFRQLRMVCWGVRRSSAPGKANAGRSLNLKKGATSSK